MPRTYKFGINKNYLDGEIFITAGSEVYTDFSLSLLVILFIKTLFLTTISIWTFRLIKPIYKNFSLG